MRDSDWSRENLLRSDWLGLIVATMTTDSFAVIPLKQDFGMSRVDQIATGMWR